MSMRFSYKLPMNPLFLWSTEYQVDLTMVSRGTPLLQTSVEVRDLPDHSPFLTDMFFRIPPDLTDDVGNLRDDLYGADSSIHISIETEKCWLPWKEPETQATYTPVRLKYVTA